MIRDVLTNEAIENSVVLQEMAEWKAAGHRIIVGLRRCHVKGDCTKVFGAPMLIVAVCTEAEFLSESDNDGKEAYRRHHDGDRHFYEVEALD